MLLERLVPTFDAFGTGWLALDVQLATGITRSPEQPCLQTTTAVDEACWRPRTSGGR
jgi:hypothetical protein